MASVSGGQVYTGLVRILNDGFWADGQLCWAAGTIGPNDAETEGGIRTYLAPLHSSVDFPFALIWQSGRESHAHLAFGGYGFHQALHHLARVVLEEIADEIQFLFSAFPEFREGDVR